MKQKMTLFSAISICLLLFAACSSNSSNGKSLAERENEIYKNCGEELDKLNESFTTEFHASNYNSRRDAIEDWRSNREKIERKLFNELAVIEEDLDEMSAALEFKDLNEFQQSYNKNKDEDLQYEIFRRATDTIMPQKVLLAISNINPIKPDATQIQKDLASRTLADVDDGFFYAMNRQIDIKEYNIQNLTIENVKKDNAAEYIVLVTFRLTGKNNKERCIDVKCNVRYVLPEYDDWTIDFQQTEELSPVKNDTYTNCVKSLYDGGWLGKDLYVENRCDKTLEVFVRFYEYNKWYKKIVVAKPQEMTFVDYGESDEVHIDYVLPL